MAILDLVQSKNPELFERIIIDTTSTEHTLEIYLILDFPAMFSSQALILHQNPASLREVTGTISKIFMGKQKQNVDGALDAATDSFSAYRNKTIAMAQLFQDHPRSEIVVVTIAVGSHSGQRLKVN